jgi:hypothetical protein
VELRYALQIRDGTTEPLLQSLRFVEEVVRVGVSALHCLTACLLLAGPVDREVVQVAADALGLLGGLQQRELDPETQSVRHLVETELVALVTAMRADHQPQRRPGELVSDGFGLDDQLVAFGDEIREQTVGSQVDKCAARGHVRIDAVVVTVLYQPPFRRTPLPAVLLGEVLLGLDVHRGVSRRIRQERHGLDDRSMDRVSIGRHGQAGRHWETLHLPDRDDRDGRAVDEQMIRCRIVDGVGPALGNPFARIPGPLVFEEAQRGVTQLVGHRVVRVVQRRKAPVDVPQSASGLFTGGLESNDVRAGKRIEDRQPLVMRDLVRVAAAYDVTYGKLGGVGPAASVDAVCSNNGGTADGQIRFADVVFRGSATSVRLVGLITPRQPHSSNVSHVPLLGKVKWVHGRIVVDEYWYGPSDPTCCASGRATTAWAYRTGKLTAVRTVVTKRPTG